MAEIVKLDNPDLVEILTGLLLLHQDLEYQRAQARRAQHARDAAAIASLRQSEQRFDLVMQQFHGILWLVDHEGRMRTVLYRPATGKAVTQESQTGTLLADHVPADDPIITAYRNAQDGQMSTLNWRWNDRAYLATVAPYMWTSSEPTGTAILALDITVQKNLELQAQEASRLDSVGRLAGGIAHDFNNLLTVIKNCAHLLELDNTSPHNQDVLSHLNAATHRAAHLVQQLLALGRRQFRRPEVVDLNEMVTEFIHSKSTLSSQGITLETSLDPDCGLVFVDPTQLEQVLMHVVSNAADVLEEGGRCSLKTVPWKIGTPGAPQGLDLRPGTYAEIAVTDTGPGMDESVRQRVFEPFFTTKEISAGNGLGLSSAYGIVKQTDGTIVVESELGKGTTVRIFLPTVTEQNNNERQAGNLCTSRPAISILFVEDEAQVRNITERILQKSSHAVVSATSANEALSLCSGWTRPPDILITDVVMPGMTGIELATHLRARWPKLPVIFVTGFSEQVIEMDHAHLIEKPYSPADLLDKITELMGSINED